ncbi:MAG: hypothetical protein ABW182_00005 [Sphingomonas sp.]
MINSVGRTLGWSVAILLIVPLAFLFSAVRTVAPVAPPLASGGVAVHLEAVKFKESYGPWPIVSTITYPNAGPIRGEIRSLSGRDRASDYVITLTSDRGAATQVRCDPQYAERCFFRADLGGSDVTRGVTVSVRDLDSGQTVVQAQTVLFIRKSSYSLALWDALMSV